MLLNGLGLGQADRAGGRVREDDGRNVGVVELVILELLAAEQAVREPAAGGDGDGRQERLANDIADGKDALGRRLLVLVDGDEALAVGLDAGGVEVERLGLGVPADSPDERVDLERLARVEREREHARRLLDDLGDVGLLVDVDAGALCGGARRAGRATDQLA